MTMSNMTMLLVALVPGATLRVFGEADCDGSTCGSDGDPGLTPIDGREVPPHAYVFEAAAMATL